MIKNVYEKNGVERVKKSTGVEVKTFLKIKVEPKRVLVL
jgi:hypothetical protein